MQIRELRKSLGDTQSEFSRRYNIPFRTLQNWETGVNTPPPYVEAMLRQQVKSDTVNRRQFCVPEWDSRKKTLPAIGDYRSPSDWLKAVNKTLGDGVVFALDSALMCEGSYLGRLDEWLVWVYGADKLSRFNGVCVIGNAISASDVEEKNGLRYTCFNRTLNDSMANERILDMQGITESLSRFYFTHNESFSGIHPDPKYVERFEQLSDDAVNYYSN